MEEISCPNCGLSHQVERVLTGNDVSYPMSSDYEYQQIKCPCDTVFRSYGKEFDNRKPDPDLRHIAQVIKMPSESKVKTYTVICVNILHDERTIGVFLEWTVAICLECGSKYTVYTTIPTKVQETLYSEVVPGLY